MVIERERERQKERTKREREKELSFPLALFFRLHVFHSQRVAQRCGGCVCRSRAAILTMTAVERKGKGKLTRRPSSVARVMQICITNRGGFLHYFGFRALLVFFWFLSVV